MNMKEFINVVKDTFTEWMEDNASQLAASLSFYTAISIAPLLVMVILIAGFIWGNQAVEGQLLSQLRSALGPQGADFIATVIENADKPTTGSIAGLVSLAVLIWGSTNVFTQLQTSLNAIWNVEPKPNRGILGTIKDRLLSFSMVLGIAFLLLVSLILSAVLAALSSSFTGLLPGAEPLWQLVNFVLSLVIITLLMAAIYKVLPDVEIAWRSVWIGAAVTALLFTIGKFALGYYLGNATTSYGAAGSVMAFLLWVYYSAQIVFFGAEFTQIYANRYGEGVQPSENARFVDEAQHSPA